MLSSQQTHAGWAVQNSGADGHHREETHNHWQTGSSAAACNLHCQALPKARTQMEPLHLLSALSDDSSRGMDLENLLYQSDGLVKQAQNYCKVWTCDVHTF